MQARVGSGMWRKNSLDISSLWEARVVRFAADNTTWCSCDVNIKLNAWLRWGVCLPCWQDCLSYSVDHCWNVTLRTALRYLSGRSLAYQYLTVLVGLQQEHSACKILSGEVLVWLSVWSEQIICIWSSWCHCHHIISCFIKIQNGLVFPVPAYPGRPGKEPVKRVSVLRLPSAGTVRSRRPTGRGSAGRTAAASLRPWRSGWRSWSCRAVKTRSARERSQPAWTPDDDHSHRVSLCSPVQSQVAP